MLSICKSTPDSAGHNIRWRSTGSHSRVLYGADTHLHTYPYNGLRFAVDPCHPRHPILAAASLALLSFPPTPPLRASLLLPLLSCFKSSSFPLRKILPIPPVLSFSLPLLQSPLPPCVSQNEWQVSLPDVVAVGRQTDRQHVCVCAVFLLFFCVVFFVCTL